MIRDPSDGSVKEANPCAAGHIWVRVGSSRIHECSRCGCSDYGDNDELNGGPVIETTTSGLQTGSEKPENIARLQRSREWLADYRAGKIKADTE